MQQLPGPFTLVRLVETLAHIQLIEQTINGDVNNHVAEHHFTNETSNCFTWILEHQFWMMNSQSS